MDKGYKGVCDNCGKETIFLFRPTKNVPKYCKECYIALSQKDIENIIKSFNNIEEDKLKDAIEFLVLKMSKIEITGIKKIRVIVENMITKLIKDKNKRDKIFILLATEEKRFNFI